MSSYAAIVCCLTNVRTHSGADRLKLATVLGNQVVVGLDAKDGDTGLLFPCDGALETSFCEKNDLYPRLDDQGHRVGGGFFDKNGRVRAQKFRGEKSDGFWQPLHCLEGLVSPEAIGALREGDQFCELDGVKICSRYETPATQHSGVKNKTKQPVKAHRNPLFKEHMDTKQFAYEMGKIPVGSIVHVSAKLHGCVEGNTLVDTLEYGQLPIREIVNKELGVHVKCLNVQTNEVEFEKPEAFYLEKDNGEWFEIELEDGRVLQITGNNPVWLPVLKSYRKTDLLVAGDVLLVD